MDASLVKSPPPAVLSSSCALIVQWYCSVEIKSICDKIKNTEGGIVLSTIQKYLYAIRQKLGSIKTDIELCKQLDHDINYKALEETVRRLLNLIYGYNLINLNRLQKNYPAIDLGDSNAECALVPSPDVEFVRDSILFHELDVFMAYQWQDKLLKEITYELFRK